MKRIYPKEDKYAAQKRWKANNRDKVIAQQRRARAKHPEKYRAYFRKSRLKNKYNLSEEDYKKLLSTQNNCCAICGGDIYCIDHDHKTGKVRGLLCSACNTGLGQFKDSLELLIKAVDYLSTKEGCK